MAVNNPDPNAKESKTLTTPYGGVNSTSTNKDNESLATVAERAVVERHGPQARQLPNFKDLVTDEERQMRESIENTKGM